MKVMTVLAALSQVADPAGAEPVVRIENVHKSFPTAYGLAARLRSRGRIPREAALRGIDLSVRRGELLGILGPNAAGKTTLLKALATLLLPDRGRIIIDGVDVARDPLGAKRKIGFCISEERSFYYRLTARANLEFFAALHGLRGAALHRRVEEVAREVDLTDVLDRRFAAFSSGMRQRLTVAPRMGKTVIFATNLLDEAWRLCDRIAVINEGLVVALGPPLHVEIADNPAALEALCEVTSKVATAFAKASAIFTRDAKLAASYEAQFAMTWAASLAEVAIMYFIATMVPQPRFGFDGAIGTFFSYAVVNIAFVNFQTTALMSFSKTVRGGQLQGTLEALLATPTNVPVIVLSSGLWAFALTGLTALAMLAMAALSPLGVLPITHALNGFRAAIAGAPIAKVGGEVVWLLAAIAILVPFSLLVFERAVAHAKADGTLGAY